LDKRFVIDNSVVMAWCFEDEISPYADFVLDSLKNMTAIVPSIWPLEVGNVLTVAERKKRLNEAASNKFIALLSELPIIVDQSLRKECFGRFCRWHEKISFQLMMLHILILQ